MLEGALRTFRRRLSVEDAIRFANILPPVLRAIFVADWDLAETHHPFEDRAAMTVEAQGLRAAHNFAPDTCIRDVAIALRRNVNEREFDAAVATLPEGATVFWKP